MAKWSERRNAVASLNALAVNDIERLLGDLTNTDDVLTALHDILPALIETYGSAAATIAADWYDDLRDEVGALRQFTAEPAQIEDTGAHSLIGWASSTAVDDSGFRGLLIGGVQKRIATFDRLTIMRSSIQDPSSVGWRRVGVGECEFCQMLLDRGAVYSEDTAGFEAHGNCRCTAEPDFA